MKADKDDKDNKDDKDIKDNNDEPLSGECNYGEYGSVDNCLRYNDLRITCNLNMMIMMVISISYKWVSIYF